VKMKMQKKERKDRDEKKHEKLGNDCYFGVE
jgi:hypothetical protein